MWQVSSRSGVATLRTAIHLLLTVFSTRRGDAAVTRLMYAEFCQFDQLVYQLVADEKPWREWCGIIRRYHRNKPSDAYGP